MSSQICASFSRDFPRADDWERLIEFLRHRRPFKVHIDADVGEHWGRPSQRFGQLHLPSIRSWWEGKIALPPDVSHILPDHSRQLVLPFFPSPTRSYRLSDISPGPRSSVKLTLRSSRWPQRVRDCTTESTVEQDSAALPSMELNLRLIHSLRRQLKMRMNTEAEAPKTLKA